MIIIGERINSSCKVVKEAIERKDEGFLIEEARRQINAGAAYIDVNCATSLEKESEDLIWLIRQIQQATGCSISIDSPNPLTIQAACKEHKGMPFINSVTAEEKKLNVLLPLMRETDCYAVALTLDDNGIPDSIEERIVLAERIIERAKNEGVSKEKIYVDPLVKPVSTEPKQARYFLEAIKNLKGRDIYTVGGLSNVSFGLPKRNLLNATFLKLAVESDIDAVIIDPTEALIRRVLDQKDLPQEQLALAKSVLLGDDAYSVSYIKAFREGRLNW